jgi:hypothetical protein
VRPDDLGALTLEALMEKTGVPHSEIEDVYMGCANQAGEDNRNVASDKASPWSSKGTPDLQRLVSFSTRTGYTRVRRKLLKDKAIGYVKGNRLT